MLHRGCRLWTNCVIIIPAKLCNQRQFFSHNVQLNNKVFYITLRNRLLSSQRSHSNAYTPYVEGTYPIYHCDVYRFSRIRHAFASMAAANVIQHCDVTSFSLNVAWIASNKIAHRPLSRRRDRCDRVIQNEGDDSIRGNG